METALTKTEKTELAKYEQIIADNLLSFYLIGMALIAIKQKKLYRAEYGTFEAYASERWKLSKSYAYQLVNAAHIYQNLAELESKERKLLLPKNEVQIRSLAVLPKKMQQDIWLKAVEHSKGKDPTGREIKLLVDNLSTEGKRVFKQVSKYIQKGDTEKRRSKRIAELAEESRNFKPLTKDLGKFSVVYADPPWKYSHTVSENRAIENHYNTMDTEEIANLPVKDICTRSAVLFLWVSNPKLEEGLYVLN